MKQDFCTGYSNYRNNARIVMATPGYPSDIAFPPCCNGKRFAEPVETELAGVKLKTGKE
jgi:hypothetical protein